jgi:allantoate deiminase
VVGRYEGRTPGLPALVLGSHLDTVRDAGKYDGMLGVVTAIACVKALHARGERLDFAVQVVGFGDEEGVRFQSTLLGSRALAGTFDPAFLDLRDADGITVAQALRDFGLDPARIGEAALPRDQILAYAELHIEQGPVLEAEGLPLGVVTSIAGATRLVVRIAGMAGHAGTVPMAGRRDALAAAAEAILAVERECAGVAGLVGTVGKIEALPGAINVIPGEARFTVDIRAGEDPPRRAAVERVTAAIRDICARRGVDLTIDETHESDACPCAPWLIEQIGQAVAGEGVPVRRLPSGAGHDAMAMIDIADVGMMFVRCTAGISHNPAESISVEDAAAGARALLRFIRDFTPRPR